MKPFIPILILSLFIVSLFYFENTSAQTSCPLPLTLDATPNPVTKGSQVTFKAKSDYAYAYVALNPGGNSVTGLTGVTVGKEGSSWTWTYTATSANPGTYSATFTGDINDPQSGNTCSASKSYEIKSSDNSTNTTTTTVPGADFTIKCDKEAVRVNEVVKCSVDKCNKGIWFLLNKEKTPLDTTTTDQIKEIPPKEIEIRPTKTDGIIKAMVVCVDPQDMKNNIAEKIILVTAVGGATTTTVVGSTTSTIIGGTTTTLKAADQLVCHFDNNFTCDGGETSTQIAVIDDFDDNTEKWQENMMVGSAANSQYQGELVSVFDPSIFKAVSFDESLNVISMKYKGYVNGPNAIKIYYRDGSDCTEFDDKCSQLFSVKPSTEYQQLSFDMTDPEWVNNDGTITQLKIDFEGAINPGNIFIDSIKAASAGFASGKKNAGVSVRLGNKLTYPSSGNIVANKGTIDFWVKPYWNGNDGAAHYFIDTGFAYSDRISVYKNSLNKLMFNILDSSGVSNLIGFDISYWRTDELHDVRVTWRTNEMNLYVDNALVANDSTVNTPSSVGNDIFIGSSIDGTNQADAVIDELIISSNVVYPSLTPGTTTTTLFGTAPSPSKKDFSIKSISCTQSRCDLEIEKNVISSDIVVYVNVIHEPDGTVYYKGSTFIENGSTQTETIPLNIVRDCKKGYSLTAVVNAYETDGYNRVGRIKSVAFRC